MNCKTCYHFRNSYCTNTGTFSINLTADFEETIMDSTEALDTFTKLYTLLKDSTISKELRQELLTLFKVRASRDAHMAEVFSMALETLDVKEAVTVHIKDPDTFYCSEFR